MIAKRALIVLAAAMLTAVIADVAFGQTSQAAASRPGAGGKFLTPLPARFVITPTDPRYCGLPSEGRCPPILVYGGKAGGGIPTIEPVIKANLPNVRVSFVLQEMSNTPIANGGVNDPDTWVEWLTSSASADEEHGGPYGFPLPGPGVTWDEDDIFHTLIYDALVIGACDSWAGFPVQHDAVIEDSGIEIGAFNGVDNTTLDHTGYYNFSYTVQASAANGKVSDFRFSGKVNVTCTGVNSLP